MNMFWLLLCGGLFFGWGCVVVDIFYLVVGGGGWSWMVVGGDGRWWMMVGHGGWWHCLV